MHTQTRSVETLRGSMFKEVTFQHLSGKTRFWLNHSEHGTDWLTVTKFIR